MRARARVDREPDNELHNAMTDDDVFFIALASDEYLAL